jgi:hypothetical protein
LSVTIPLNITLISAKIKNTILDFIEVESEVGNKKKFKIINFDNISHYSCVSNSSTIEFIFNTKTKFSFQYDRGIGQCDIRKALVHSFTGIPLGTPLQENNPINLSNMSFIGI